MDILETARLLRFHTDWERRFHEYCLLTEAGIPDHEALSIATQAAEDRAAREWETRHAA